MRTHNGIGIGDRVRHKEPISVQQRFATGVVVNVPDERIVTAVWPSGRYDQPASELEKVERDVLFTRDELRALRDAVEQYAGNNEVHDDGSMPEGLREVLAVQVRLAVFFAEKERP